MASEPLPTADSDSEHIKAVRAKLALAQAALTDQNSMAETGKPGPKQLPVEMAYGGKVPGWASVDLFAGQSGEGPDHHALPENLGETIDGFTEGEAAKKESDAVVKASFADKPKVQLLRAPAGGKVSEVDGQFYKGGWLMPIHGLSPKKDKTDEASEGTAAIVEPNEDSKGHQRQPRSAEMTPEQIADEKARRDNQAKWDEINAGPLGRVKWFGDSPNSAAMKTGTTNLNQWKEYAESVGEERLKGIVAALAPMHAERIDAEVAAEQPWQQAQSTPEKFQENIDWAKDSPRRAADDDATQHGMKKHLQEVPSSLHARQLVQHLLEDGKIDTAHQVNRILAQAQGTATSAVGAVPEPQGVPSVASSASHDESIKDHAAQAKAPAQPVTYDPIADEYKESAMSRPGEEIKARPGPPPMTPERAQEAMALGFRRNKHPFRHGSTTIKPGEGWIKKDNTGAWITYSDGMVSAKIEHAKNQDRVGMEEGGTVTDPHEPSQERKALLQPGEVVLPKDGSPQPGAPTTRASGDVDLTKGGEVPETPGSDPDKDSVKAVLKPGDEVIPKREVETMRAQLPETMAGAVGNALQHGRDRRLCMSTGGTVPDESEPHLRGTKENPAAILVLPGRGKDGKPLELWHQDTRYAHEMARVGVHPSLKSVEPLQEKFTDLVDDIIDGVDADETVAKGLSASKAWETDFLAGLDRRHAFSVKSIEQTWDKEARSEHLARVDAAKEAAKQKVLDALADMNVVLEDTRDNYDWSEEGAEENRAEVDEAIGSAQHALDDAIKEAFADYGDVVEDVTSDISYERDQREEEEEAAHAEEASEWVEDLNGDAYVDDPETALEDAKFRNQQLAESGNRYRVWHDDEGGEWVYGDAEDLDDYPGKAEEIARAEEAAKKAAGGGALPERASPEMLEQKDSNEEPSAPSDSQNSPRIEQGRLFMAKGGVVPGDGSEEARPAQLPDSMPEAIAQSLPDKKITDFGHKIGGARKDTARPTGPKAQRSKEEEDERPAWMRRYEVSQIAKSTTKDEEGKWAIRDSKDVDRWGQARQKGHLYDSEEAAQKAIPLVEVARNHRVRNVARSGEPDNWAIVREVSDRKRPSVKDGFASEQDAMKYMALNPQEIIEHKVRIDDSIHPMLEKVERVGPDYREGKDANPEDFQQFGFYGVEFGNWNNQAERQHILNHSYDSFRELADVLDMPPNALSLDGQLGIGFGSRGHGLSGSRAHYERDYGAINLTKLRGAGSLAHEWMHALDHYLGRKSGKAAPERESKDGGDATFQTSGPEDYVSHGHGYKQKEGYRPELKGAVDDVMDAVMHRTVKYTEDESLHEKRMQRAGGELETSLGDFRAELARDYSGDKYKRGHAKFHKPASKEQLAEVDALLEKIRTGDVGENVELPSKKQFGGPEMPAAMARLNEIHKEVRGRNAWHTDQSGRTSGMIADVHDRFRWKQTADKFLADAKEKKEKEKKVKTDFFSQAKRMDEGQAKDYWSEPHEMMARAFESYVYDKIKGGDSEKRNDFLAYEKHNELPQYKMFGIKPYPEGEERQSINAAFDKLFATMQDTDLHSAPGERPARPTNTVRIGSDAEDVAQEPLVPAKLPERSGDIAGPVGSVTAGEPPSDGPPSAVPSPQADAPAVDVGSTPTRESEFFRPPENPEQRLLFHDGGVVPDGGATTGGGAPPILPPGGSPVAHDDEGRNQPVPFDLKLIESDYGHQFQISQGGKEAGRVNFSIRGEGASIDDVAMNRDFRGNKSFQREIYPQIEQHLRDKGVKSVRLNVNEETDSAVGTKVWGPLGYAKVKDGPTSTWRKGIEQSDESDAPRAKMAAGATLAGGALTPLKRAKNETPVFTREVDGKKEFVRPFDDERLPYLKREMAARQVAGLLGMPTTEMRVEDVPGIGRATVSPDIGAKAVGRSSVPLAELSKAMTFDIITGNVDSNPGNYFLKNKELIGHDYELAFGNVGATEAAGMHDLVSRHVKKTGSSMYDMPLDKTMALKAIANRDEISRIAEESGVSEFAVKALQQRLDSIARAGQESEPTVADLVDDERSREFFKSQRQSRVQMADGGTVPQMPEGMVGQGQPSPLPETMGKAVESRLPERTQSEAFKNWFGDSRIVDGDGRPLRVFSGQPKGRTEFHEVERSEFPQGVGFFTLDREVAELYAGTADSERAGRTDFSQGKDGEVGEYYLSAQRPWDLDSSEFTTKSGKVVPADNIWLAAAARREMGEDEYQKASNRKRMESGLDYLFRKYPLPPEAYDEEGDLPGVDPGEEFLDYLRRQGGLEWLLDQNAQGGGAANIDGQGYTLQNAIGSSTNGRLAVLEPDLANDIIDRHEIDAFEYSDGEHDGAKVFVPFDSTQIKSTNNRGTFDPADPRIHMETGGTVPGAPAQLPENLPTAIASALPSESDAPAAPPKQSGPFYSRLQRAIEGLGDKPIPAQSVKNRIEKSGISKEEWQWTNMDAALADKKQVTRDELLEHFDANQVRVQEVMHGDTEQGMPPEQAKRWEFLAEKRRSLGLGGMSGEELQEYNDLFDANERSHEAKEGKFSTYQTPGGTNYRELLLTLPSAADQEKERISAELAEIKADKGPYSPEYRAASAKLSDAMLAGAADYHGAHWEEANVLAHVRFNDREGPLKEDGTPEKQLHIEEIQSDWHQEGREKGYKGDDAKPLDWKETHQGLPAHLGVAQHGGLFGMGGDPIVYETDPGYRLQMEGTSQKFDSLEEAKSAANQAYKQKLDNRAAPDAPFKDSWHDLAMKRMLHYAAEGGYDRITLNSGEQINKVLGNHSDSLEGQKQFYGSSLSPEERGQERYDQLMVKHPGLDPNLPDGGDEFKVRAALKAKNITKREAAVLRGQFDPDRERAFGPQLPEMSIAEYGQSILNDAVLPKTLERLAKPFGAKIEPYDLPQSGWVIETDDGRIGEGPWNSEEEAEQYLDAEVGDSSARVKSIDGEKLPTTSLTLTPKIREQILQRGFPHMEEGGVVGEEGSQSADPDATEVPGVRKPALLPEPQHIGDFGEALVDAADDRPAPHVRDIFQQTRKWRDLPIEQAGPMIEAWNRKFNWNKVSPAPRQSVTNILDAPYDLGDDLDSNFEPIPIAQVLADAPTERPPGAQMASGGTVPTESPFTSSAVAHAMAQARMTPLHRNAGDVAKPLAAGGDVPEAQDGKGVKTVLMTDEAVVPPEIAEKNKPVLEAMNAGADVDEVIRQGAADGPSSQSDQPVPGGIGMVASEPGKSDHEDNKPRTLEPNSFVVNARDAQKPENQAILAEMAQGGSVSAREFGRFENDEPQMPMARGGSAPTWAMGSLFGDETEGTESVAQQDVPAKLPETMVDAIRTRTGGRDQMTREQFAEEYATKLPSGMSPEILSAAPEVVKAWRESVVNHYFDESGERRGITDRLKRVDQKESAFATLKKAHRELSAKQPGNAGPDVVEPGVPELRDFGTFDEGEMPIRMQAGGAVPGEGETTDPLLHALAGVDTYPQGNEDIGHSSREYAEKPSLLEKSQRKYGTLPTLTAAILGQAASWGATGALAASGLPLPTFGLGPVVTAGALGLYGHLSGKGDVEAEPSESADPRHPPVLPTLTPAQAAHRQNQFQQQNRPTGASGTDELGDLPRFPHQLPENLVDGILAATAPDDEPPAKALKGGGSAGFMDVVHSAFGEGDHVQPSDDGSVKVSLHGREISLDYDPRSKLINTSFFHGEGEELHDEQKSGKQDAADWDVAAKAVQPGSLQLMRSLKKFASGAKDAGMGILYQASQRRADIYEKTLSRIGFEKTHSGEFGEEGVAPFVWKKDGGTIPSRSEIPHLEHGGKVTSRLPVLRMERGGLVPDSSSGPAEGGDTTSDEPQNDEPQKPNVKRVVLDRYGKGKPKADSIFRVLQGKQHVSTHTSRADAEAFLSGREGGFSIQEGRKNAAGEFVPKEERAKPVARSLYQVVKERGGISLSSTRAVGDVKALQEGGLRALFTHGGRDIEELATELHSEGIINIPDVQYHDDALGARGSKTMPIGAGQFLLDQLEGKAQSLQTDMDDEFDKEYYAFLKEQQDAERYAREESREPDAVRSELAEAESAGQEDGVSEAEAGDAWEGLGELAESQGSAAQGELDPWDFPEPAKLPEANLPELLRSEPAEQGEAEPATSITSASDHHLPEAAQIPVSAASIDQSDESTDIAPPYPTLPEPAGFLWAGAGQLHGDAWEAPDELPTALGAALGAVNPWDFPEEKISLPQRAPVHSSDSVATPLPETLSAATEIAAFAGPDNPTTEPAQATGSQDSGTRPVASILGREYTPPRGQLPKSILGRESMPGMLSRRPAQLPESAAPFVEEASDKADVEPAPAPGAAPEAPGQKPNLPSTLPDLSAQIQDASPVAANPAHPRGRSTQRARMTKRMPRLPEPQDLLTTSGRADSSPLAAGDAPPAPKALPEPQDVLDEDFGDWSLLEGEAWEEDKSQAMPGRSSVAQDSPLKKHPNTDIDPRKRVAAQAHAKEHARQIEDFRVRLAAPKAILADKEAASGGRPKPRQMPEPRRSGPSWLQKVYAQRQELPSLGHAIIGTLAGRETNQEARKRMKAHTKARKAAGLEGPGEYAFADDLGADIMRLLLPEWAETFGFNQLLPVEEIPEAPTETHSPSDPAEPHERRATKDEMDVIHQSWKKEKKKSEPKKRKVSFGGGGGVDFDSLPPDVQKTILEEEAKQYGGSSLPETLPEAIEDVTGKRKISLGGGDVDFDSLPPDVQQAILEDEAKQSGESPSSKPGAPTLPSNGAAFETTPEVEPDDAATVAPPSDARGRTGEQTGAPQGIVDPGVRPDRGAVDRPQVPSSLSVAAAAPTSADQRRSAPSERTRLPESIGQSIRGTRESNGAAGVMPSKAGSEETQSHGRLPEASEAIPAAKHVPALIPEPFANPSGGETIPGTTRRRPAGVGESAGAGPLAGGGDSTPSHFQFPCLAEATMGSGMMFGSGGGGMSESGGGMRELMAAIKELTSAVKELTASNKEKSRQQGGAKHGGGMMEEFHGNPKASGHMLKQAIASSGGQMISRMEGNPVARAGPATQGGAAAGAGAAAAGAATSAEGAAATAATVMRVVGALAS